MSIETLVQRGDPNLPLRLALSHRAKAREGLAQRKRDLDAGVADKGAHDLLVIELEHELARAEATVRKLRDAERASIVRLEANLRLLKEEQDDLPDAVRRGAISASGANDANRNLKRRIGALEGGIAAAKARIAAEYAEDLGGRVDLPFEKYQGEVPYTPKPVGTLEWVIALLLSVVAAGSVFLPWLRVGASDSSLIGLSRALENASIPAGGAIGLVWLPLVLLPFASIPCAAFRKKLYVGWGLLLLGVLVTTAGLLPGALLNRGNLMGLPRSGLFNIFGPGSMLYCGVGIGFITMGGLRVGSTSIALKQRLAAVGVFAGAMVVLVIAVMAFFSIGGHGAQVSFEASLVLPGQDAVRVICRCRGKEGVDVFPSWSGRASSSHSGRVAGIDVYARERGGSQFRLIPNTEAAWSATGLPGEGAGVFRLAPDSSIELTLDLRRLTSLGANVEAIRLQFYLDSRELTPFEANLGASYLSPPAETPALRQTGPSPTLKPPKRVAPAPVAVSPAVPKPEPVLSPSKPATPLLVSFVGIMGEKAVLKVVRNGQDEERFAVGVGDLLDKDWAVAKIERAPSAVTVTNTQLNLTRVIQRGETVDLNAPQ